MATKKNAFKLEIDLGNEAMQTPTDVARALRETADKIEGSAARRGPDDGKIRDLNGNTVGKWQVNWVEVETAA